MTTQGFLFCQVIFVVIVIPCAVGLARLQIWLVNSVQFFHQLSIDSPNMTVVLLWILPTLIVTLALYSLIAGRFVEFQKAE